MRYMFQDESEDDEDSDEDSSDSAIEDDQTSYLRELRDQLVEERQRTLERQHAYEARISEQR